MDDDHPGGGLFPKHYNVDTYGNGTSEEVVSNADTTTEMSDIESNGTDSIDSSILAEIMVEQCNTNEEAFKESLSSNKFYISQLYNNKTGRYKDDNGKSDFIRYNQRIEQEYKLRGKLERLLNSSTVRNKLNILNTEGLYENYVGGDEVALNNSKYSSFKDVFNKIKMPRSIKKASYMNRQRDLSLEMLTTHSGDTHIIDMENHGEWPIDHDHLRKSRTHKLESWISVSKCSNNNSGSRKQSKFIKKYNALKGSHHSVQRKLEARHIQMIASGSSLGVGLFLTSGKAFTIAGPFGALLGYVLCGSIVMASTLSFTELCALIPLTSGFSGLASRFVEDAFGFALGWLYWFSFIIAVPSQVVASTMLLNYYQSLNLSSGKIAGFVTLFLVFAIFINLCDVRIFGNFVYFVTIIKIIFTIVMIFVMIVLNSGGAALGYDRVGFRFWDAGKSAPGLFYGLFRPTFNLKDEGSEIISGISGAKGRLLAIFLSMLIAAFTYSGIEMTFVASCEVKNPKKALPSAMKKTLYIMLLIYTISIFVVGLNIYSGDPRLPRFYTYSQDSSNYNIIHNVGMNWQVSTQCQSTLLSSGSLLSDGNRSAWVIALRSFGRCTFASVLNGILIFYGATSGCSSLYGASHTLYSMAIQGKAPRICKTCTSYGVPWIAVLVSGIFGVISYMAVDQSSLNNFQILANISSATICIIWAGMNVSFLRFFYALKIRPDIMSRDDPMFPYRSPFQPYLSYYGLFGSLVMIFFAGFTSFFHGFWNIKIFFSCYGGLVFFIALYIGYKLFGTSKLQRLDQIDMDIGRIELDRTIWNEQTEYQGNWKERLSSLVTWIY
ncbi:Ssy1 [Kluyveromyces lactis]|nr:Ssy1 [Kluyveromyces lactis]